MNYKGYTYLEEVEKDDENMKHRYHYAVPRSGKPISLDYTQWESMTQDAFKTLVDLGFPKRPEGKSSAPWTSERLKSKVQELEYASEFTMNNDSLTEL